MDHFGPKVNGPFWTSNLQIQSKDIFKFCLLKEAKKHMKIIIIFSKFGLGQMGHVDLHSKFGNSIIKLLGPSFSRNFRLYDANHSELSSEKAL